jgi:O-antigen/teichoic acid export membrane protein
MTSASPGASRLALGVGLATVWWLSSWLSEHRGGEFSFFGAIMAVASSFVLSGIGFGLASLASRNRQLGFVAISTASTTVIAGIFVQLGWAWPRLHGRDLGLSISDMAAWCVVMAITSALATVLSRDDLRRGAGADRHAHLEVPFP